MSDMMIHEAVRFELAKDYKNYDEAYKEIGVLIEEKPKYFDEEDSKVKYFHYEMLRGKYALVANEKFYLDFMLGYSRCSEDDMDITLTIEELIRIKEDTLAKFGDLLTGNCKVKIYEWYNGSDMPVDF